MSLSRIRKPSLIVLSLLLALAVLSMALQPAAPAPGGNAIALKAPSFVSIANAQEEPAAVPMGFPQDEAGISAYFKSASPVTLADVRDVFRVIEVETADYIIGSVAVPNHIESFDVHVFVHRTGWFVAYYLSADPVGKIINWVQYAAGDRRTIPTLLEKALADVAGAAGVPLSGTTYYDFRYPNATHLMLIAEDTGGGNDFQINLPSTYNYYHRSWSARCTYWFHAINWVLDGTSIFSSGDESNPYSGTLTGAQLLPDMLHTITIGGDGYGGLALVYRVP